MQIPTIQILLVEDHRPDIILTQKAFAKSSMSVNLHIVRDGEEALQFLYHKGEYANAPRPDLVLLDINLPRKSGLEVLAQVKFEPELLAIPVIMLTSSSAASDVNCCYEKRANAFLVKPASLAEYGQLIEQIESIWLEQAKFPK